jgi:hypothetical protein
MYRLVIAMVGLGMVVAAAPGSAQTRLQCEVARINARAGGPTNERDAWLLETCGCEPGSTNAFCQSLEHRQQPVTHRKRQRPSRVD